MDRNKLQDAIAAQSQVQLPESEYQLRGEAVGLFDAGRYAEAGERYRRLFALKPGDADIYHRYGVCLYMDGRPLEAIVQFRTALKLNLDSAACCCDLGVAYQETGQYEEAENILSQAVTRYPNHAPSHYNLATALLVQGKLKRGWQEYQWRLRLPDGRVRKVPFPIWEGESLQGSGLLVFAEQGVGDEVMYASCIPQLLQLGAGAVQLECDPRLQPVFARSFPGVSVTGIPRNDKPAWKSLFPDCNKAIAIASLPAQFRSCESDFPRVRSYLRPDPVSAKRWAARYAALGHKPKIGISWRGGRLSKERLQRTTALSDWAAVLHGDATFINLQYGDCREELAQAQRDLGVRIHDWDDADPLVDLDNFLAQISELDLVISIDNSTVHFAGAVGTPVWNILPPQVDFRWMLDRDDTPWYASMRLFRQRTDGNWRALFDEIGVELDHLLAAPVAG